MQPVTSAQNPAFQRLLALSKDAGARREFGRFLVEGPHLAAEALQQGVAHEIWASAEALADPDEGPALTHQAKAAKIPVHEMSASLLGRVCDTRQPQGWVTVVRRPDLSHLKPQLWLALDGIQDPGNLGTILRSAWAAQAGVLVGDGSADAWAPKVLRSAAGAHFATPIQEGELVTPLKALKAQGFRIVAADPKGDLLHTKADFKGPLVLVIGAEGAGLGEAVLKLSQQRVRISYPGGAESLNAAISGSLLLFEALRQRSES